MKPILLPLAVISSAVTSLHSLCAQTVPFDSFESYVTGPLSGQGNWLSLSIGGSSQITVTTDQAFSGSKSVYLFDGDPVNRPKARYDYPTGNTAVGTIDFSVKTASSVAGHDLWQTNFFQAGSTTVTFSLVMASATDLHLTNGSTTFATFNPSPAASTYNFNGWNEFIIVFNDSTKSIQVYLNGGASPILSSADTSTTYQIGRIELTMGSGTATGQGVYFDNYTGPQWETTAKLRYAPPNLVAPLTVTVPLNYYSGIFADTDDVLFTMPTTSNAASTGITAKSRTSTFSTKGGRNLRIIGGDMGAHNMSIHNVTGSAYVEGIKADFASGLPSVNGYPVYIGASGGSEADALDVTGVSPGAVGAPQVTAPDVYVQNCYLAGVHGTNNGHDAGVAVLSCFCTATAGGKPTIVITPLNGASTGLSVGDTLICGATDNPGFNSTYTVNAVDSGTKKVTATLFYKATNPLSSAVQSGDTANGGYLWRLNPNVTPVHGDCYQVQNSQTSPSVQNCIHFYKCTLDSSYQCFIGLHEKNDQGARGLYMTRVNMRASSIWPQDYGVVGIS